MASYQRTESGWRVYVCYQGIRRSKTFRTKGEASRWARSLEASYQKTGFTEAAMTFGQLLDEYATKVSVTKRGGKEEMRRLLYLGKDKRLAHVRLCDLRKRHFQDWIEEHVGKKSPMTGRPLKTSTVARYMTLMKAVLSKAVDWEYIAESPARGVVCKVIEEHRERVATPEEIEALKQVAQWDETEPPVFRYQRIIAAFIFACYTGMRIGEIVRMERSWILDHSIRIPREATKTYHGREIAVPARAMNILKLILKLRYKGAIWGLKDKSHDAIFRKLRNMAGLGAIYDTKGNLVKEGLNFHDSRATFCTWAASPGPDGAPRFDVMTLARQTGHRNLRFLMVYYRRNPADFVSRLEDIPEILGGKL